MPWSETLVAQRARPSALSRSVDLVDVLVLVLLALLPLLRFWRLVTPYRQDQMTITEGDFTQEYFPLAVTVARAVREGEVPLWNPYSNGGQPLLADPQNAVLYPFTWLVLPFLTGHDGESLRAFQALVPLHFALAGIFSYLLARRITSTRGGAVISSLTFTYSGLLTSYPVQQLPILRVAVWLPVQFLALLVALEQGSYRWAIVGGLALAMAVLAGHPQTLLFQLYALGLLGLYRFFLTWWKGGGWRAIGHQAGLMATFGTVGATVSAAQLLPTYEFMLHSNRAEISYAFASSGFRPSELLLDILAPGVLGGLPPYVGVLPLLLALLALLRSRHSILPLLGVLAAFGLFLSLGGHTFLYPALYVVAPGFDLFRNQERGIYLFVFAISLLAGLGADRVLSGWSWRERRAMATLARYLAALLVLTVAVEAAIFWGYLSAEAGGGDVRRWREIADGYSLFVLMLGLASAILLLRLRWRLSRVVLPGLMAAVVALDLFSASARANLSGRKADEVFQESSIVRTLRAETRYFRVDDREVLNGNHGLVYAIPTIGESFAMRVRAYSELAAGVPRERLQDLLAAGYVVTRDGPVPGGELVLEEPFQQEKDLLFRRPAQRAYLAADVVRVASPGEALKVLASPAFRPGQTVVLEGDTLAAARGTTGQVTRVEVGWNRGTWEFWTDGEGLLVLSEVDFPGWRATLDGTQVPLHKANYALRAVAVPAGQHALRLEYRPAPFYAGVVISLVALAGSLVTLLRSGAMGPGVTALPEGR